jgi:hypothetical protein
MRRHDKRKLCGMDLGHEEEKKQGKEELAAVFPMVGRGFRRFCAGLPPAWDENRESGIGLTSACLTTKVVVKRP